MRSPANPTLNVVAVLVAPIVASEFASSKPPPKLVATVPSQHVESYVVVARTSDCEASDGGHIGARPPTELLPKIADEPPDGLAVQGRSPEAEVGVAALLDRLLIGCSRITELVLTEEHAVTTITERD